MMVDIIAVKPGELTLHGYFLSRYALTICGVFLSSTPGTCIDRNIVFL